MARTVLLTGATGFIGSRLARLLHARGDRLRCVVRSVERAWWLRESLDAELVLAELTDVEALASALNGCDLAYHLAAVYDVGPVNERSLELANVEGTRAFLAAAERAGTPRVVYISSTAALAPATNGESRDIEASVGPYPSIYHRTKAEAHRLARAAQQRGLPVIIACPAFVYGPGDNGPGGRFIKDLVKGRVPALLSDPAWFSYVHVDDVAHGLDLLGERGEPGATYVLSGEVENMNGFARRVVQLAGVRGPLLRFPSALVRVTGSVLDAASRVTGRRFLISREGVDTTARTRWLHSHERMSAELGWSPRGLEAGLPETVAWAKAAVTS